jgi:hypothetical protein
MKRAGRPLWAVIATAVLFILTTVTAALVSRHKARQAEIILGEVRSYRALDVQAGFPAGWEISPVERVSNLQVIIASPPDVDADRQMFLFRIQPSLLGPRHPSQAVSWTIRAVDPQSRMGQPERLGPALVGELPSEVYRMAVRLPALGSGTQSALANVAVTPDRRLLGVLLIVDGPLTNRDGRMLSEVSETVSYRAGPTDPADDDPLDGELDELEDGPITAPRPSADGGPAVPTDVQAA